MSDNVEEMNQDGLMSAAKFRLWLRRVMPRVAFAGAVLLCVWLLVHEQPFYREHAITELYGFATFLTVFASILYFGLRGFLWLKRRLLWRVRRRLIVTYLFVGLTPIVLLSILGVLFAVSISVADQPRVVAMHMDETKKEVLSNARLLRDGFLRQPANASDKQMQSWLDEQAKMLQGSLPGARVAVWRRTGEDASSATHADEQGPAQFASDPGTEETHNPGSDTTPDDTPLPQWSNNLEEWDGIAFIPAPEDSTQPFSPTSIRALSRAQSNGQSITLLLVVPISRTLVQQLRESTGVEVHPFFFDSERATVNDASNSDGSNGNAGKERKQDLNIDVGTGKVTGKKGQTVVNFKQDQFGEPISGTPGPVMQTVTNWETGEQQQHVLFLFHWTLAGISKQILSGSLVGHVLQWILIGIALFFLLLELLAVLSAAWMTRAVTGTVHRLYRATEFIKRGDFSHRVSVRSRDQLGELAGAFNEMSANVESLLHERVERERLEREVEIAAEVQAQLFPRRVPDLLSVEVAAECRAARGVAGDYYDYVEIAPGLVAFALGDVSGKGISASLVMSNLQASLRAQATITSERLNIAERAVAASVDSSVGGTRLLAHVMADAGLDGAVSRMSANINRQLCQSTDANRFATLFLALYEERTRTLRYTNAGHNAAILVREDGTVERLKTGGMMAGAFDWATYEEAHTNLEPGDTLLIFSDGISEAERVTGEEYGEARLVHFAIEHRTLNADELRRAIFTEIENWSSTQERGDDQTLVIIKSNQV
ncbi:MAG TPA: SpoIIE family protein phosphatase [Pyrinomonadaceae bacterium]|nr:SpoIIE family protein phosphatase [Pyrinomonadaceae bacterium]